MYKSTSTSGSSNISDGQDDDESSANFSRHKHDWTYEFDLQLAAELGKTLLQRNQELERDLSAYQDLAEDQALEIDFLNKQVQLLRDESGTRLAACEMLDGQLHELKRSEGNLTELRNLDYLRITRLQDTVEVLQSRSDELQAQVTELKRKKWEDKFAAQSTLTGSTTNGGNGLPRSISHGEALKSAAHHRSTTESDDEDQEESENRILREKVRLLQRQVTDERKQRDLLQNQVANIMADNTSLWSQLNHVTKDATTWRDKLENLTTKYAEEISALNEQREKAQPADTIVENNSAQQLSILDEIADSLRDRFLDDLRREQIEHEQEKNSKEEVGAKVKSKTTQTDTGLIIDYLASRGGDPTHGRFERGPPEYKKLFKEIFDIIKRSQEEDAMRASQPGQKSGKNSKPKKQIIHYYNQF
ncbi:hypothetical protein RvY_18046 [Ramazzottius varieornatus]|uniref:Uncharacterized protein n=1 Tax=Ramazzottius varieornatus TaxID=947166 RepID=A0A1D1W500_RAMVA|nr:hypothetical protein RvY_18046 [Ramazzottius varieornatus]